MVAILFYQQNKLFEDAEILSFIIYLFGILVSRCDFFHLYLCLVQNF